MGITVGSARIDEHGKAIGGAAGDQTKSEVSTQAFYMHSKGWYVLRPKSISVANKIASAMKEACSNDKIGYDQGNRTGVITNVKKYGSMKKIAVKTESDCSSLVRGCIWQATGKDVGNFRTVDQANFLEKSGLFEKRKSISSSKDVYNGDVLVTKTSGHTVVVVSGRPRKEANASTTSSTSNKKTETTTVKSVKATHPAAFGPIKSLAGTYNATVNVHIRNGAGTTNKSLAVIPKGKACTCYGYYSNSLGAKWLYVLVTVDSVKYTGFVHNKYLKKK